MEKLKVAVIGLGRMGAEVSQRLEGKIPNGWLPISHVESAISIPQFEVVAFCDTDTDRLYRLGQHYNVLELYTDFKNLINESKPDVLCIATRTEGRTDIIKYAAQNGVRIIYFEKPISRTILDCKETIGICNENNVIIGYGVNRRYHNTYREAKTILKSGRLGNLKEIIVEHGKSPLYWTHPHSVDIILFFADTTDFKYLQSTCAIEARNINGLVIDEDPIILNAYIQFENGVSASINQANGLNVRLVCESGTIAVMKDGERIEIYEGSGYEDLTETLVLNIKTSATENAFKELLDACMKNAIAPIATDEILAGMTLLNGFVYSSLNEGKRITKSEIPSDLLITGRSGSYYA
jgi:scyllo-inositol 2-dehydrogenase (NAD+)